MSNLRARSEPLEEGMKTAKAWAVVRDSEIDFKQNVSPVTNSRKWAKFSSAVYGGKVVRVEIREVKRKARKAK